MRPLASRMSRLGTETAFEVLARARALEAKGRDIVHLEIGEPDFDTPPSIVAAGVAALERGETHYTPSARVDELRSLVTARTKVLVLNSPHNPTGGVLSPETIHEIARIARERDLWVLADEIYAELIYDGTHRSILAEEGLPERTILLDGFSKTFAMTGWRLGYGVVPR